jgi:flavin reductase (DIM6/NTAB) family NADH-FMN oxidoreductase RutF
MSGVGNDFDRMMQHVDQAMIVVTAALDDERAGCLVGFHTQCSIDPPRYAVWLSKANHTFRVALHAGRFAVHFLSTSERDLAELFGTESGDDVDKFEQCETEVGPHGVPLLTGCANKMVVRRTALFDEGGDHVCFVAEPLSVVCTDEAALLQLSQVAQLDPGHGASERPQPSTERA